MHREKNQLKTLGSDSNYFSTYIKLEFPSIKHAHLKMFKNLFRLKILKFFIFEPIKISMQETKQKSLL